MIAPLDANDDTPPRAKGLVRPSRRRRGAFSNQK
jgi:hypothetical protein